MSQPHSPAPREPTLAPALTVGFAVSVSMWLVGYLTHLPAIQAPTVVVGILLILVQLVGGFAVGCFCRSNCARVAIGAGLVTSLVNMLVLGSLLVDPEQTNALRPGAIGAVLGYAAFSITASLAGALVGRFATAAPPDRPLSDNRVWLTRFALVTAAAALPVLLSGGLVTSTNTGLAVTDWPTSFNANMFLYPLSRMTGGVYFEHAHRLFGSLVGLSTLTLFLFGVIVDKRTWIRAALAVALLAVIAQGVLGGVRVTAATPTETASVDNAASMALAMVHGILAQLFFAYLCVIGAFLSPRWRALESGSETSAPQRADGTLRRTTLILLIVLFFQLCLGSGTRHFGHAHLALTHTAFALVVLTFAALAGFRASGRHKDEPILRRLGGAVAHTVGLQLVLGGVTLFLVLPYQPGKIDPPATVIVATAHQAVGALLLALSSLLFVWTRRLTPRPA